MQSSGTISGPLAQGEASQFLNIFADCLDAQQAHELCESRRTVSEFNILGQAILDAAFIAGIEVPRYTLGLTANSPKHQAWLNVRRDQVRKAPESRAPIEEFTLEDSSLPLAEEPDYEVATLSEPAPGALDFEQRQDLMLLLLTHERSKRWHVATKSMRMTQPVLQSYFHSHLRNLLGFGGLALTPRRRATLRGHLEQVAAEEEAALVPTDHADTANASSSASAPSASTSAAFSFWCAVCKTRFPGDQEVAVYHRLLKHVYDKGSNEANRLSLLRCSRDVQKQYNGTRPVTANAPKSDAHFNNETERFFCVLCGSTGAPGNKFTWKKKDSWTTHMLRFHAEGELAYRCPVSSCAYTTACAQLHSGHVKAHMNVLAYKCDGCARSFNTIHSLNEHRNYWCPADDTLCWICEFCGVERRGKPNVMAKHHRTAPCRAARAAKEKKEKSSKKRQHVDDDDDDDDDEDDDDASRNGHQKKKKKKQATAHATSSSSSANAATTARSKTKRKATAALAKQQKAKKRKTEVIEVEDSSNSSSSSSSSSSSNSSSSSSDSSSSDDEGLDRRIRAARAKREKQEEEEVLANLETPEERDARQRLEDEDEAQLE